VDFAFGRVVQEIHHCFLPSQKVVFLPNPLRLSLLRELVLVDSSGSQVVTLVL
jgi:hypothetical protein